jgi:hypothetical protein
MPESVTYVLGKSVTYVPGRTRGFFTSLLTAVGGGWWNETIEAAAQ